MHERWHGRGGAAAAGTWPAPGPGRVTAAAPVAPGEAVAFSGRGWDRYLMLVVLLLPVLVPMGPQQTAFVDLLNVLALTSFTFTLLVRGTSVSFLFLIPVLAMATGSLLATTNARSVSAAAVTMLQDAYLYAWFVALVAVMARRGELLRVRIAWVVVADLIVLYSIAMVATGNSAGIGVNSGVRDLLPTSGFRPAATFYNANQFGSYLVVSLFVVLGLLGRAPWALSLVSLGLIGLGLVHVKSNGALIATLAGLIVWAVLRAWANRESVARVLGQVIVVAAALLLFGWAAREWGIGSMLVSDVQRQSFIGRLSKSTESRSHIRRMLQSAYQHSPLGIAPGNSKFQPGPIGERVREDATFPNREAHSDYVGYAIERGPVAFLGLLALLGAMFLRLARGRGSVAARVSGRGAVAALWASLVAALVAILVHSLVIEALHFRHIWAFLALACALTAPWTPARPAVEAEARA